MRLRLSRRLHYNYFRDYDPATGRYPQSDPLGLRGGLNTYAYAFNNPVRWRDPLGLASNCDGSPGCQKASDECYEECKHKLGVGGRTNQGFPYRNCWQNCMTRKGCREVIDPLPDINRVPLDFSKEEAIPEGPTEIPNNWWVLILLIPFPGNPLYAGL